MKKSVKLIPAALVLALGLAGCSSSDKGEASSAPESGSSVTTSSTPSSAPSGPRRSAGELVLTAADAPAGYSVTEIPEGMREALGEAMSEELFRSIRTEPAQCRDVLGVEKLSGMDLGGAMDKTSVRIFSKDGDAETVLSTAVSTADGADRRSSPSKEDLRGCENFSMTMEMKDPSAPGEALAISQKVKLEIIDVPAIPGFEDGYGYRMVTEVEVNGTAGPGQKQMQYNGLVNGYGVAVSATPGAEGESVALLRKQVEKVREEG